MRTKKIITREIEQEITVDVFCDNCKKVLLDTCGGIEYILSNGCCIDCGRTDYDFCSLKCLKTFVDTLIQKEKEKIK